MQRLSNGRGTKIYGRIQDITNLTKKEKEKYKTHFSCILCFIYECEYCRKLLNVTRPLNCTHFIDTVVKELKLENREEFMPDELRTICRKIYRILYPRVIKRYPSLAKPGMIPKI